MDLYHVCSNYTPAVKNGLGPRGHMINIGLYTENMKNSSCLNHKAESLDIWCVASSQWTSTTFVQIMTLEPKMAWPQGSHKINRKIFKHEKIFLSETTRPLICSITLWTLYQVYSYYAPGAKNVPPPPI